MKTSSTTLLAGLSNEHLLSLTREVKETIASGFEMPEAPKSFTSVDLWKVHNSKRTYAIRQNFRR
jgi:hypothetical protein